MKEERITFDELMNELNSYKKPSRNVEMTDEQKQFLIEAREKNVPFRVITILWKKAGWGQISDSALRVRYYRLIEK